MMQELAWILLWSSHVLKHPLSNGRVERAELAPASAFVCLQRVPTK